jgi:endonuclease/exonuclease/phosphatase (EEP) superfamily protein YafD
MASGRAGFRQTQGVEEQQGIRQRSVRHRVATCSLVVAAVPFVALAVLRFAGFDGGEYTIAALALTPYAAAGGLVLGAVALILRRWWTGGVVVLLALTLTALVLPRVFASDQPEVTGRPLRVLASNLLAGRADPHQLVNLVRDNNVDVVNLVELTSGEVDRLTAAGLFSLLPNKILHPGPGASGSGMATRLPLSKLSLSGPSTGKQPSARLDLGGGVKADVVAVHPAAPTWSVQVWRTEFGSLPKADLAGPARILAGDFNATLDLATLRGLLDTGYADAAEQRGDGLSATWPSAAFPPPVTIDHILVDRRVAVKDYRVFTVSGSDHRAVYAELLVPA